MKLYSITMINSGNFSFAHLTLDAKSIQLSGRNNKGKTSFLWTLPLLFVVDRKQATHPSYTPRASLNFYFKSPDKSYIIFEGYDEKQGYFYMLLRREGDSIRYHFVRKKFDYTLFMQYNEQTQKNEVLPFSYIMENPAAEIGAPLKSSMEILAKTISSKKGEVAFLRLHKDSKSRQFSDLYKHLFRSSSDNDILKNGILIVNGLKDEVLSMRDELPPSKLAEWKKEQDEIDALKEIRHELSEFKKKRNRLQETKAILASELTSFEKIDFNQIRKLVNSEEMKYATRIKELIEKISQLTEEKNAIKERISSLDTNRGEIGSEIKTLQAKIKEISAYQDKMWLVQELQNLDDELGRVRGLIKDIGMIESLDEIGKKLHSLRSQKGDIEQFVNNNQDTLLMNLSSDKRAIGMIYTVLNSTVTSLPKSAIISETTSHEENTFTYNGAKIDISSLEIREIPTIDERKRELKSIEEEIKKAISIKENYYKKEELEAKKKGLEEEAYTIRNQLKELENLSSYQNNLSQKMQDLERLQKLREKEEERETLTIQTKQQIDQEIQKITAQKDALSRKEQDIGSFYSDYLKYCEHAGFSHSPVEAPSIESLHEMIQTKKDVLEKMYHEYRTAYELYHDSEKHIRRSTATKINLYDDSTSDIQEDDLLMLLERKCEYIDIREKELADSVLTITNIFMNRVKRFLEEAESIKKYTMKINSILSKYTISDLSGIHICYVPNERQIAELEQLIPDNTSLFYQSSYEDDPNEPINRYVRTEKTIPLSSLFEIEVERTKKDSNTRREKKEKSKQSNGTERMLHVMLLLILMRELIHPEDTIPFLIDEVMDIDDINQDELLKFFDELNLLPISASPHVAHTFEKIYHIEEESDGTSYINDNTYTRKTGKEEV